MAKIKDGPDTEVNGFTMKTHYIPGAGKSPRRVRVLLPKFYEEEKKEHYPVVYIFDGQNLFFDNEAYMGRSWKVSETLAYYPDLPDMIVVGIDSSNDRLNEYSPWKLETNSYSQDLSGYGGSGEKHAEFFMKEVKPFIEQEYRVLKGPEYTALIGCSLGASFAAYIGMKYPDDIGALGLFSLANQYFRHSLKIFLAGRELNQEQKVYIQVGTEEVESSKHSLEQKQKCKQDYVDAALECQKTLLSKGLKPENIELKVYVGEEHNEYYWGKHLPECFRFLSSEW